MAQPAQHPWIARLLPSLTDVAFLMPVIFLFAKLDGFRGLLGDGDTGWHVRTGQWILAHHQVPRVDIFSYTKAGQPWFAWEWLWDVLFGWLHQQGGMAAVVVASMLILCFTFALVFRLALRRSGNPILSIVVTFLAVAASSIHWHARPHLVTMLFTAVFLSILDRVQGTRADSGGAGSPAQAGGLPHKGLLWWLPALMLLWTNLHGGFFVGIVLVLTYAAGELAAVLFEARPEMRMAALQRSKPYLLCAGVCALVSFANPYGYHLHEHIFSYFFGSKMLDGIGEFQSINFHNSLALYFESMLLLAALCSVWNIRRKRFVDSFLLLGWAHLALLAGRNIAIFVIVAAPIAAVSLREMIEAIPAASVANWCRNLSQRFGEFAAEFGANDRLPRVHLASAVVLAGLLAVAYAPNPPVEFRATHDPKHFPVRACNMLGGAEHRTGIFTLDQWADYVIYRFYPNTKVFFDGRSDFYGPSFTEQYTKILSVEPHWERKLARYGVDTILLPVNAPLAGALKQSSRWAVTYDDGYAIMFRLRDWARPKTEQFADAPGGHLPDLAATRIQKVTYAK